MQKALITTAQIRAGRALLRWSSNDLSSYSGIGISTIKRLETMEGVPSVNVSTLIAIQNAFESNGVEFVGTPDNQPGVRLK
jgi:transcriptional regulator with XRE-family HTH domain